MAAPDLKSRSTAGAMAMLTATVFTSAGLVFLVQPMAGRLVLPNLGGSPAVWNTSMAFFQAALLAGYAYAHLLQRLRSLRAQIAVHLALLLLAAVVLPLHVTTLLGSPSTTQPGFWLLGVLALSLGAPFAMLSSTAPLIQAWYARRLAAETGREPYSLYAASNLGSLLALAAYPLIVEPNATLRGQTLGWSLGYGLFVVLIALSAIMLARRGEAPITASTPVEIAPPTTWRDRLSWLALAAIPSSLMLGVTAHIATDIASAPFLWVAPLGLYLITFILVFRDKPVIAPRSALLFQAVLVAMCITLTPFRTVNLLLQIAVHLGAFFLTALICHQALYARRPPAARLTEFYMWMSLGGVVGGAFNAFVAPVVFPDVWEYPLMLALSVLARPWGRDRAPPTAWIYCVAGIAFAVAALVARDLHAPDFVYLSLMLAGGLAAMMVRDRAWMMLAVLAIVSISADRIGDRTDVQRSSRSFFGVLRESRTTDASLGGEVRMLAHGTTLHGAQAQSPAWKCRPTVYYSEGTPIGQVFLSEQARKPALRIGAVGLGTGAVAAYVRPTDHLTFFEIDPLVVRISGGEGERFTFVRDCAKGPIDFVMGDARLTLAQQPNEAFDLLLIDAFSSDAIPTHLMTVEALQGYLAKLKPDGVVVLHLSNRNLALRGVAEAVAVRAGGVALAQRHLTTDGVSTLLESSEDVLIVAHNAQALTPYAADQRWTAADPRRVRPWTDDYINVFGALVEQMKERWASTTQ